MIFMEKCFLCCIVLADQISLSDYLYWMRHRAICVLQLFVNQALTSYILKLTLSFSLSRSYTLPKSENKILNIWRKKRAYKVK